MNNSAIVVEHLSKSYQIGQFQANRNLREVLSDAGKLPLQMILSLIHI